MKKILFIVLGLSFGIANAQENFLSNTYVGLGLGQSTSDYISEDLIAGVTSDDKDTAWKIFYGISLHQNFGLELQYSDLGEFSATNSSVPVTATLEYKSVGVSGMFKGNVSPRVQLFAKLGFHRWKGDAKNTLGTSASENGTDFFAGVGANFHLGRNYFARVEYERFKIDLDGDDDDDVDLFSASLIYKF